MKPTNDALQVFYGTLPLVLIVVAVWFRGSKLLNDILSRLGKIEDRLKSIESKFEVHGERITRLEERRFR